MFVWDLYPLVDQLECPCVHLLPLFLRGFVVVYHNLHNVVEADLHESLSDMGGEVHGRGGVDLDQPHLVVLVDHEVVPVEFMGILPVLNVFLSRHHGPLDDAGHLPLDFLNNPECTSSNTS